MSELRIIPVVFGGKHFIITDHRMQYDYGQVLDFRDLELPDSFEARFSNSPVGESIGQIGTNNRIRIPKQFFESGEPIYCYITLHDEVTDGRTVYTTKVPIKPSTERTEEEPEPEEESIISQAITALNSAVTTTTQKASEASESASRAEQAAEGVEGYAERAETAQGLAESARDRAIQAEESASASATTATTKASEALSSATAASQSVIDAEQESERARLFAESSAQSAQGASQFAVNAGGSAYSASESAQEASGYARNASASAETASQKALEASQSASTAVQAKTDAITAKTASETAQGLAESARDEAVTAKADAESARDEAQSIVDGITGKVEQIDSNTTRIESLEDDRYKPYPTDTASGSVASFTDGADDIPLKSCIVQIEPVQSGSGDPSPDNVRPISGWTGCEVQRTGKNLADEEAIFGTLQGWTSSDGVYTGESRVIHNTYKDGIPGLKFKPSTQYTVSVHYSGAASAIGLVLQFLYTDGTKAQQYCNTETPADFQFVSFAGKTIEKITLSYGRNMVVSVSNFQIEEGSTATDYEPYTGQTYPITFPASAGTVYGGYVNVTGGELVVDRAMVDLGTLWWAKATSGGTKVFYAELYDAPRKSSFYGICSKYKRKQSAPYENNTFILYGSDTFSRIGIRDDMYGESDGTTFKASLSGVQLVYELATPIHYPLTPTEIKTLLGTNNIWADTGNVSVEYRADTKLYIEKLTQPEEYDMIADSAITGGQFFMVGNSLYRALANIASGATITVGTNAERVSLSDALNLVNA